jgi:intermembrane space import and assembly protein 40
MSLPKNRDVRAGYAGRLNRVGKLTVPPDPVQALPETEVESEHLPTIESIAEERKRRQAVQAQLEAQKQKEAATQQQNAQPSSSGGEGGMGGLEQEADQQGAFNPETGEINWDCPCLGGMADGPCGPQFKAAFSCFVYSTEEPKGMDCIERFKYVYTLHESS